MFNAALIAAMALCAPAGQAWAAGPARAALEVSILAAAAAAPDSDVHPHNSPSRAGATPFARNEQPPWRLRLYAIAMTLGSMAGAMAAALYFQIKKDSARFERDFNGGGL